MEFDGKRWVSVPELVIGEAVRLGIIDLYTAEAKAKVDPARLQRISGLFSVGRIFAIVRIAKGYLFVRAEEFDAHPDLLNVNNGVVDLRNGTLGAHDPALRFTKLCPTDYIPGATHADWAKALAALPDAEVRVWLQVRFGQSITGYPTPDDVMTFLNGGGENGKTHHGRRHPRIARLRLRGDTARPGTAGQHRRPPDRTHDAVGRTAGIHGRAARPAPEYQAAQRHSRHRPHVREVLRKGQRGMVADAQHLRHDEPPAAHR